AISAVVYLPWFAFVDRHGGYSSLMQHHRSYLGGAGTWYPFWAQQLAQSAALSGGPWWEAGRWSVAFLGAAWVNGFASRVRLARWWVILVAGAALSAASASLGWWIGLAVAPWLLFGREPGTRVLGAWWLLLSILTPFYHPYARLWLPLGGAGWLL